MKSKLLTTGQVAEMFGLHQITVARWCDKDGLMCFFANGDVFFKQKTKHRRMICLTILRKWLTINCHVVFALTDIQAHRVRAFISQEVVG